MASADPLDILRQFTVKRRLKKVLDEDGTLQFGDVKFPKQTPTRLRTRVKGGHHSLGSLFLFFSLRRDGHVAYMKACKEQGLVPVSLVEKKKVMAYLNGTTETINNLDPLSVKVEAPKPLKTPIKEMTEATKDQTTSETMDMSEAAVAAFSMNSEFARVLGKELILNNRCTVLLGQQDYSHLLAAVHNLFTVDSKRPTEKRPSKTQIMRENKRARLLAGKAAAAAASGVATPGAASGHTAESQSSSSTATQGNSHTQPRSPIIVVPAGLSAMLTMFNARSFLEDGKFMTSAQAKKSGVKKQRFLRVKHTFDDGKTVQFKVVDVVKSLSTSELNRIAVVIVAGPKWQFKGWRLGSTAKIFARAKGIHLHYDSTVPPGTVKEWKVSSLKLSKNKRHLDGLTYNEFWAMVHKFLQRQRPEFLGWQGAEKSRESSSRRMRS